MVLSPAVTCSSDTSGKCHDKNGPTGWTAVNACGIGKFDTVTWSRQTNANTSFCRYKGMKNLISTHDGHVACPESVTMHRPCASDGQPVVLEEEEGRDRRGFSLPELRGETSPR